MRGTRPLDDAEIDMIREYFDTRADSMALRDKTLFFFGLYTGFRIAEILSVRVEDVYAYEQIADSVYLKRANTKGKKRGRTGLINGACKELLREYFERYGITKNLALFPHMFLFHGYSVLAPLSRTQAWRIFKQAFAECELQGKLACHTTRKTFARKCFDALDHNLVDLQQCMGHQSITSTQSYIAANDPKIADVLKNLNFSSPDK